MLFDLRGRGRRRTVKVIYLSLAILMGGGLVLFGVGGNTNGGLLDAFKGGSQSTSSVLTKRLSSAEAAARAQPTNPQVLADLTRARYQAADFDQTTGAFTADGRKQLRSAAAAWQRYLAAAGSKPDDNLAGLMVQAFSPQGINQPVNAVKAMEIVVDARPPTANLYVQLAFYAFNAGQIRKGQLASDKAIQLAPKDDKEQVKSQL